jgi:carotenoid 1,2-hydratase
VAGGGRGASGGGRADGGPVRPARGRGDAGGPAFDITVDADGYAWWYVDGVSDDGTRAVSVIGFIGSVFSPWYRWSGRRVAAKSLLHQRGDLRPRRPLHHDRPGPPALRQTRDTLEVGPSRDALGRRRNW